MNADGIPYSKALEAIRLKRDELDSCVFFLRSTELQIERIEQKIVNLNRNLSALKRATIIASAQAFGLVRQELRWANHHLKNATNEKCLLENRRSILARELKALEAALPTTEFKLLRFGRE